MVVVLSKCLLTATVMDVVFGSKGLLTDGRYFWFKRFADRYSGGCCVVVKRFADRYSDGRNVVVKRFADRWSVCCCQKVC